MKKKSFGKGTASCAKAKYRLSFWELRKKGIEFTYPTLDKEPKLDITLYKALQKEYREAFKSNSGRNYETEEGAIRAFYLHLKKLSKSEGWADHYDTAILNKAHQLA